MNISRRQFLQASAAALLIPRLARAQDYPARPVRWVVGYPPGGATDIVARMMGQWLSERLKQPFIIENRPGASGNLATLAVANAPADGYTLLLVNAGNAINTSLYDKLAFNFPQDIEPIASIVRVPLVLLVNPSIPVKSVPEFIDYARDHPGRLNMASAGNGTPQHVAGELLKMMAGIDLTHVPYHGSAPAMSDLLGGQVQAAFETTAASIAHIRAGRLRPLAVTTSSAIDALPEVPPMARFVPGYEASGWYGAGAPRNTPAEIVGTLNREINAGLASPVIRARVAELGATAFAGSPAEFGRFMADETGKWAKVVRFSGAKAD